MTRKQFFKECGLDQPSEKEFAVSIIKKYGGRLSYSRFYMLIYTAVMLGKRGAEIWSYIDVVVKKEVE